MLGSRGVVLFEPIVDCERGDHVALAAFVGPIEHLNVGIGVGSHGFSATAELQTAFALGDSGTLENATLSARYQGSVSPYVSISTPFDHEILGELFVVSAGLTIPL